MKHTIYLDYAATTPVDQRVVDAMLPYFSDQFGNPASLHQWGRQASEAVEKARRSAADFFSAKPEEIVFTSGATEANNLAIKGVIRHIHNLPANERVLPHIITSAFEHHCVLDACQSLEKEGVAEVTYLTGGREGIIDTESVRQAIKPNTLLVSIMFVNNEIGTIQSITKIGKMIRSLNETRKQRILFHTDATQAVAYCDCDVENLKVDLLSMSAHKIYGPKGVGLLYIRQGAPIQRIQDGGDQEGRKRAGTLNVTGIVGLGKAMEILKEEKDSSARNIGQLRDHLINRVLSEIPDCRLNGSVEKRSPNNAHFSFENVEGESLILSLDLEGIACSTGSACTSNVLKPSHVLLSLGLKPEQTHGSIRLTMGRQTTQEEVDKAVDCLKSIIGRLRKVSGQVLSDYYANNK